MPLPRLIPCLDVAGGRVVKGVRFEGLRDVGDPVELGAAYSDAGADELVFLDIVATVESRAAAVEVAARVAEQVTIPFTFGGGIRSVEDAYAVLEAGADKVSVNSAALARPALMSEYPDRWNFKQRPTSTTYPGYRDWSIASKGHVFRPGWPWARRGSRGTFWSAARKTCG